MRYQTVSRFVGSLYTRVGILSDARDRIVRDEVYCGRSSGVDTRSLVKDKRYAGDGILALEARLASVAAAPTLAAKREALLRLRL